MLFCHPSRCSGLQASLPDRKQSSLLDRSCLQESSSLAVFTHCADFASRAVFALRRRCLRVRQSRSASTELTPSSQCGALVSSRSCATSRNPSPFHVLTHVFCMVWESPAPARVEGVSPELGCSGSAFFSARSWVPPCRVCDHSRALQGKSRRWSLCLEGLLSALFVGHCCARLPAIVHCGPPSAHALTCGLLD